MPPEVLPGIINLLMIAEQQEPPQAAALRRGVTFFPRLSALHERIQAALHPGVR